MLLLPCNRTPKLILECKRTCRGTPLDVTHPPSLPSLPSKRLRMAISPVSVTAVPISKYGKKHFALPPGRLDEFVPLKCLSTDLFMFVFHSTMHEAAGFMLKDERGNWKCTYHSTTNYTVLFLSSVGVFPLLTNNLIGFANDEHRHPSCELVR